MAKANITKAVKRKAAGSTAKNSGSKTYKPKNTDTSYLSTLCERLEKAAAGLTYTSESDYSYQFFNLPLPSLYENGDQLNVQEFLNCIGLSEELINQYKIPVDQLIEERPLDNFFPSIDDLAGYYGTDTSDKKVIAESKRYRKLEALLNKQLKDVKVFRVGRIDIRCYIVGFAKQSNIAGLVTISIET